MHALKEASNPPMSREYLSPNEQRADEDVAPACVHPLPRVRTRSVGSNESARTVDHVEVAVGEREVAILFEGGHGCRQ